MGFWYWVGFVVGVAWSLYVVGLLRSAALDAEATREHARRGAELAEEQLKVLREIREALVKR